MFNDKKFAKQLSTARDGYLECDDAGFFRYSAMATSYAAFASTANASHFYTTVSTDDRMVFYN